MRPCDCKDKVDLEKLDHQGTIVGGTEIEVRPNLVILTVGQCKVWMPQRHFERMAQWYLGDQGEAEQ
jgi:hypothetical protein